MKSRTFRFLIISLLMATVLKAQNPGDSIFGSSQIHTIKLYFNQSHWWDSLVANYPLDKKMLASVEFDGMWFDSVGAQFKGNSSYNNPTRKKPFKVDMNEYVSGQKVDGLKKFNLNNGFKDPTFMREKMTLDFCRRHGLAAPRCTYANLYLNDTLWGLYTFIEQIDKTYLETMFSDDDGNLFKGDPQGSLQWFGPIDTSYFHRYELKTNETANDWSDLVHLLDEINNTAPQYFFDSLEAVMNTPSFLNYWAMNILFSNLDSYNGSGHNYYIYHHLGQNRFIFIAWDVNEAFGVFTQGMSISQLENLSITYLPNGRPLVQKMIADQSYFNQYRLTLCDYLLSDFNADYFFPIIDSLANTLRSSVYADSLKFFTNLQFEDNQNINSGNIPGLKSFINNRVASVSSQLSSLCFSEVSESATPVQTFVFPNPASERLTIACGANAEFTIEIFNATGELIHRGTGTNYEPDISVDVSLWANGFYFYAMTTNAVLRRGKFSVIH